MLVDRPLYQLGWGERVRQIHGDGRDTVEVQKVEVVRAPATTRAPSSVSAFVVAMPIPLLAPVTTATLPSSFRSISFSSALTSRSGLDANPGRPGGLPNRPGTNESAIPEGDRTGLTAPPARVDQERCYERRRRMIGI